MGTYPPDGPEGEPGRGEGIWRVLLDPATGALAGHLVTGSPAPSFLALSPDGATLYAVGETAPGTVTAFDVLPDGALALRGRVGSGGDSPCHVVVAPDGRTLYVSNYGSGSLAVLPLAADGGFSHEVERAGGPVQVLDGAGSGPRADRQEGPHAHFALLAPGGRHVLVADLGADELRRYRVLDDGLLAADGVACRFAPGTGPRHLAVGPGDHLYVVGELTATLHVLAWDAATGTATELATVPACHSPVVSGTHQYPAHPVVVGDRLLVTVRGADVVAEHVLHDGGRRLAHVRDVPVGGAWPRHVAAVDVGGEPFAGSGAVGAHAGAGTVGTGPRTWLVVAVQNGGRLTSLAHDHAGLTAAPHGGQAGPGALDVPFPACVLEAR